MMSALSLVLALHVVLAKPDGPSEEFVKYGQPVHRPD